MTGKDWLALLREIPIMETEARRLVMNRLVNQQSEELLAILHKDAGQNSPIREITRKEIVPGTYSGVGVDHVGNIGVGINFPSGIYSADELEAAASVLTQIAGVLRENGNG